MAQPNIAADLTIATGNPDGALRVGPGRQAGQQPILASLQQDRPATVTASRSALKGQRVRGLVEQVAEPTPMGAADLVLRQPKLGAVGTAELVASDAVAGRAFTQDLDGLSEFFITRSALEKFAAVQMIDVAIPTTDGREVTLTRYTQPERDLQLLLHQLKLQLPEQPPPKISAQQARQATPL
jgi:hypothetical protein